MSRAAGASAPAPGDPVTNVRRRLLAARHASCCYQPRTRPAPAYCAIDPLCWNTPQHAASRSKRRTTFDNGGGTRKSRRRYPPGVWRGLAAIIGCPFRRISPERTPNHETGSTRAVAHAAECPDKREISGDIPRSCNPAGLRRCVFGPRGEPGDCAIDLLYWYAPIPQRAALRSRDLANSKATRGRVPGGAVRPPKVATLPVSSMRLACYRLGHNQRGRC